MPFHSITCSLCGEQFLVCTSCYRGQRYCSPLCRRVGYANQRKLARLRYAKSLEAKLDHRERNKLFRIYGRQTIRVMDHTSAQRPDALVSSANARDRCLVCRRMCTDEDMVLLALVPD